MYLGGNGLNCEVELDDDLTAMVCHNGDAREVERRGLESRFHLRGRVGGEPARRRVRRHRGS